MSSETVFARNRRMHLQNVGHAGKACDWCHISEKNEIQFLIERRVDRTARTGREERVAVRRRAHYHFCADGAGARSVLDDERLA